MARLLLTILVLKVYLAYGQEDLYLDQPPPADMPQLFAPGIISDQYGNRDMAISPNGDEMFYTLQYSRGLISAILYSQKLNGKWTNPVVASFLGEGQFHHAF